MRILVISNFYPPHHKTGYALGCRNIVESLEARGHDLQVLTSVSGLKKPQSDGRVHRWLVLDSKTYPHWHNTFLKEVANQTYLKGLCRDFDPDIVFLFDLSEISVSLALAAQEMGLRTCFYVSNDWLATWKRDRWYQVWPRENKGYKVFRFLSHHFGLTPPRGPLEPARVIFASSYLKQMAQQVGQSIAQATVVPWGIDIHRFSYREADRRRPRRLLYVGQIGPQKGLDVAIEALGILKKESGIDGLSLTIAGDDLLIPDYAADLRDLAASWDVLESISFIGPVPSENMPDLYQAHEVLIFPSVNEEPLTISLLEAMSSGLGVVSTSTGGNSEILRDESNALVIPKENPRRCAQQIQRLLHDPGLYASLRSRARHTVEEEFRLDQTIHSIEEQLTEATGQPRVNAPPVVPKGYPSPTERVGPETITRLTRRAKRWLKFGDVVVLARAFLKPDFLLRRLRVAWQKYSAFIALFIFPVCYKAFFLLTGRHGRGVKSGPSRLRGILVIQLADLGDVTLTAPFLRELRRFLPRAKIALIVQPGMFNMVEKCPYIDEVLTFEWRAAKNWQDAFQGHMRWWLEAFRMAVRRLWKNHFDLAISLRWNDDPCQAAALILMYSSGAPRRIAYIDAPDDYKLSSLINVNRLITQGPVRGAPKHEIEYQMDILRFVGGHPEDTRLEVWTTQEDDRFAQNVLDRHGIKETDLLVALAPGARWPFRRWPETRFLELGRWLQETYQAYIMIIAAKPERNLAFNIERGLSRERTVNLAGNTTLREMASVLKHCKFFFGHDSGPMHVAIAAGVPSVGLFGPGEYERFRPCGQDHGVIRLGLSCNPCSENCQFNEALCIKGITVSQVKAVLAKRLGAILHLEINKD